LKIESTRGIFHTVRVVAREKLPSGIKNYNITRIAMEVKDLKPALIWQCFDEITKVPRPSCHEEKIREYLLDFAKKHGIAVKTDAVGNVVMSKKATSGRENAPVVVLQAHMDMVAEKNSGVEHDFLKDPIETYIDGDWVKARGTTLGADNGIGMAAALAVMIDDSLEHGPVEALFTVNEEIGLEGAQNLGKDMINGKILINLDSEDDGEIFVGCAGGIDTTAVFTYKRSFSPENFSYYNVKVSGLLGGHSGGDIHLGRANANKVIARFIWECSRRWDIEVSSFTGGNLRNAIPREAEAVFGIHSEHGGDIEKFLEKYAAAIRNEYKGIEPNMDLRIELVGRPEYCIDSKTSIALVRALYSAPHGVISMSHDIEGLVETSTNLAAVKMEGDDKIKVTTSQRSSVESRKEDIAGQVEAHFQLAGAEVSHSDGYPGWAPNMESTVMRLSAEAYEELFGVKPAIKAIHAGLECGLFLANNPGLDMVSFGPTMTGVHSPDEQLLIPTVDKFWRHLELVLKKVASL
jgi:Xaa-His dipeptidase